jgi:hypothetical protein
LKKKAKENHNKILNLVNTSNSQLDVKIANLTTQWEKSLESTSTSTTTTATTTTATTTTTTATTKESIECQNSKNWPMINRHRYYFGNKWVTYREAVNTCTDLCGQLFEPKSSDTNRKVFTAAKPLIGFAMWIGLHDIHNEGRYMYSMITIVYGSILPPTSLYQRKKSGS